MCLPQELPAVAAKMVTGRAKKRMIEESSVGGGVCVSAV